MYRKFFKFSSTSKISENPMKPKKSGIYIIILSLLLLLAVGYILNGELQKAKQQERQEIFAQGIQQGYSQAIIQLMQKASTCQTVPIFANNITMNIIAVDCLSQAGGWFGQFYAALGVGVKRVRFFVAVDCLSRAGSCIWKPHHFRNK